MKKYLLNLSKNKLLTMGFEQIKTECIFFNNLSKGEINRDSVRERMCIIDYNTCQSETIIGNSGCVLHETRYLGVFHHVVNSCNIEPLKMVEFRHDNHPELVIKVYDRNGIFGFSEMVFLEVLDEVSSEILDKLLVCMISEVTNVDLFEEYNLASNKSNSSFEVEDKDRMYDLCSHLNIPMNETMRNYWMKVINVVQIYENLKNIGHITQKQFFEALGESETEINQDKLFKQFKVFKVWFNTTHQLLESTRDIYFFQKAQQLEEARKLMEENLF